ncbi:hypothetical protein GCM10027168_54800 [Streptomyces capparidis]
MAENATPVIGTGRRPVREHAATTLPVVPVRARGMTVEGSDGRRYLDCLYGSLALGHQHPVVLEALRTALGPGAPPPAAAREAFTSAVLATLPEELAGDAVVRFCGAGPADAAETALGLARAATGRPGLLVEPVRRDGVTFTPDEWLRRARRLTHREGAALVVDETRGGVGRTGAFWSFQHSAVVPDAVILSHAVGGGLPLSVVVHRGALGARTRGRRPVQGNRLALAAGTAIVTFAHEHGLAGRAAAVGERIAGRLRELAADHPFVTGVRGRGLLLGLELDHRRRAAAVQSAALRLGLLVEPAGRERRVIRIAPPLTITDEQADAVLDRLAEAVRRADPPALAGR